MTAFAPDGSSGVGNSLGMVAAGIGDHTAGALAGRQLRDFVEGAAKLEAADGLQSLSLNPQRQRLARNFESNQRSVYDDPANPLLGRAQLRQRDQSCRLLRQIRFPE